jgi:hypothetical protein
MGEKADVESTPNGRIAINVANKTGIAEDPRRLVDLNYEYERGSGRVIVDPAEAEIEVIQQFLVFYEPRRQAHVIIRLWGRLILDLTFRSSRKLGKSLAAQLKLDKTGKVVLWPQPSADPNDPQNWSDNRKLKNLIISTMAAFVRIVSDLRRWLSFFANARMLNIVHS